tara:strand:+ start:151 stop:258 length:108 start_codon:yes stop_codon:yes gene_type:complete
MLHRMWITIEASRLAKQGRYEEARELMKSLDYFVC